MDQEAWARQAGDGIIISRLQEKLDRIEAKCVHTLFLRGDMPYSEVHDILDLIREERGRDASGT